MTYESIVVRKSAPMIGTEIYGDDLSQRSSNRQFGEIHRALMRNLVVFFRVCGDKLFGVAAETVANNHYALVS